MKKILFWLTKYLPYRVIQENEQPYMERYFLFEFFGIVGYIHRFVASDPDRGLHDHPWPWAMSFILSGWYTEETRGGPRVRKWFNFLLGDSFHRVLIPEGSEVWTLFIHRNQKSKDWGFMHDVSGDGPPAFEWKKYIYPAGAPMSFKRWWKNAPLGKDVKRS